VRLLALTITLVASLVLAAAAWADYGIRVTTSVVRVGGVLRGVGNAPGMPVYLVPESRAPRPFLCHGGKGYCSPRTRRPPATPYVLLGRFPDRKKYGPFAFRVPRVAPGRYQVVFWCRVCGGSLILAGGTLHGQVISIRRYTP
jgi:hypothetical protein